MTPYTQQHLLLTTIKIKAVTNNSSAPATDDAPRIYALQKYSETEVPGSSESDVIQSILSEEA